jgi:hypothetical protein
MSYNGRHRGLLLVLAEKIMPGHDKNWAVLKRKNEVSFLKSTR